MSAETPKVDRARANAAGVVEYVSCCWCFPPAPTDEAPDGGFTCNRCGVVWIPASRVQS